MNISIFSKIRLAAISLTFIVLIGHHYLPLKRVALHPADSNAATLYADEAWGGKTTAAWVDQSAFHWRCTLVQSEFHPVCGLAISFPGETHKTRDLSRFDAISVRMKYTGEAKKLRIYMRNHNPEYSDMTDVDSLKFNSVLLPVEDFATTETLIHLTEFAVADWWLEERDIPRELSLPEHNNIAVIGIDFPYPQVFGQHDIEVERIELVGSWITNEDLYLGIILIWMLLMCAETCRHFLQSFRHSRQDSQKIQHLTDYAKALQQQTDKYKELSTYDTLTGVFNRNGLAPTLEKVFHSGLNSENYTIILFDVDHFKRINDRRGHDAGDRILVEIAKLIKQNIRGKDTIARWGGEEFIIISADTSADAALQLAEKLRQLVFKHRFEKPNELQVSISLGVVKVRTNDSFEQTFKRADIALYKAKDLGRNCAVIAD